MVLEARRRVDDPNMSLTSKERNAYNAFGYEEAARSVYDMTYNEWKQQHMKPATTEQLERYQASTPLHAIHDPALLQTRPTVALDDEEDNENKHEVVLEDDDIATQKATPSWAIPSSLTPTEATATKNALASNVCCADIDEDDIREAAVVSNQSTAPIQLSRDTALPYIPPPIPDITSFRNEQFPVTAILTISDRAYAGIYADEGGPAVANAVRSFPGVPDDLDFVCVIVPDDAAAIQAKLRTLADQGVDLILTTGGTGFAARDVTPEATAEVVDYELSSLIAFCMTISAERQNPLQTLSRGTAGILNQTVIANLPGNPAAIDELMPILLPLVLHAVADVHNVTPEILHIG
jgi:molybdopterin adenylyltransferase